MFIVFSIESVMQAGDVFCFEKFHLCNYYDLRIVLCILNFDHLLLQRLKTQDGGKRGEIVMPKF